MDVDSLSLEQIEYGFAVTFGQTPNVPVFCPYCEDSTSTSQSCSVSRDGVFKCHGKCQTKGTVVDYLCRSAGLLPYEAEEAILRIDPRYAREKTAPRTEVEKLDDGAVRDMIERAHAQLMASDKRDRYRMFHKYLNEDRGLDDRTITLYEIGADEYRLTIPIYWEDEIPGIRRYLPNAPKGKKIRYNLRTVTTTRIFPYRRWESLIETDPTDGEFVILCEGEWDCLLLNQHGYNALTTTAGVTNWRDEWYQMIAECLRGRDLVIMFDVNDKNDVGQRMARRRASEFVKHGVSAHVAELPLPPEIRGGDVTDWFIKCGKTKQQLDDVITASRMVTVTADSFAEDDMTLVDNVDQDDDSASAPIGLIEALRTRQVDRETIFQAQVVAKADSPYRVPSHVKVTWSSDKDDDVCGACEIRLARNDARLLSLVGIESIKQHGLLKAWAGVPKSTRVQASVDVLEYTTIEEVHISPVGTDMKGAEDRQVPPAYSVGLGIAANMTYRFTGLAAPRPKDQHSCFLIWKASIDGTDIDTFELDDDDEAELASTFQSTSVGEKMADIAHDHAMCRTSVYGRSDLHQLIDLVYHSPLRFSYGNERGIRGRLDVGVFGDTRTGKSQAAEQLQQFYGVGSTMLCENKATASGIMGGVSKINGSFVLKPGRIPLAHRRLLICDEMNQLSRYEIGNLTGVRSSGEVRIEKIVHGVFPAETRLIWISNPRDEDLDSYCHGIEMVKDLIGDSADIARFDAVLIVSSTDVPKSVIDTGMQATRPTPKYAAELCRKLVLWAWSRRSDQVTVTQSAVKSIYDLSYDLSKRLHQSVPLMLEAEARHKLARFAAAAAGRLFSTTDGEMLIVDRCHVEYAHRFLMSIYDKPASGFVEYSAAKRAEEVITEPELIDRMISRSARHTFSQYVLSSRELSRDGLMIAAGLDHMAIFQFMHILQRCGAIRPGPKSTFIRNKAFKNYLTDRLEREGLNDGTTPQESP